MAARRSFARTLGKFQPQVVQQPVAIVTAFQGGAVRDTTGWKITDPVVHLTHNRKVNSNLVDDLKRLNLSFYLVTGAGQEERRWFFGLVRYIVPSSEESFVVQPRGEMLEAAFVSVIHGLLQMYNQFGAAMKLPSSPQAFLLRQDGSRQEMGSSAGPRTVLDNYYTQLRSGHRAEANMLSPWEIHGERNPFKRFINWLGGRAFMNRPADCTKISQRFSIKNPSRQEPTEE